MSNHKQFHVNTKSSKKFLIVGVCAVACAILSFFDNSGVEPWIPLSCGIGAFSLYFLHDSSKNYPMIAFFEDHLVLRKSMLTLLTPKRMILYRDIKSINTESKKEILLAIQEDGKNNIVKLPTAFFNERDVQEIIEEIKKRVEPNSA